MDKNSRMVSICSSLTAKTSMAVYSDLRLEMQFANGIKPGIREKNHRVS